MKYRTIKVCQECGKEFQGSPDMHYCPECAQKRKSESVVRIRICADCGAEFPGGPRARRCPSCAAIAQKKTKQEYMKTGPVRPLGSKDKCKWCGREYIVKSGRQKYCSPQCQREALLEWQREHKKGYHIQSGQNEKRTEKRMEQEKICVYCGRTFRTRTASNLCSEYCRKEQYHLRQCMYDMKKGNNRNLQRYIDKRTEYREKIKEEMENDLQTL